MRGRLRGRASALAAAVLVLSAWGCDGKASLQGMAVDPPRAMPTFEFTLDDRTTFRTAPEAGRPMVLFFGYTHCPDVCPTTLADWKRVAKQLGDRAARVRFVFVSVDPDRDTPAVAARYAKQFDAQFVGVSGSPETTFQIMTAFGVAASKDPSTSPTNYLVSHSAQVFLVDPQGRLVALYPFNSGWEALAADLESLL